MPEKGKKGMFSHVSIGVRDIEKAVTFYDAVLGTLGYGRCFGDVEEGFMAYGTPDCSFIVSEPLNPERGKPMACNGSHVCLNAPSCEAVSAFYEEALRLGATGDGEPGLRADYGPGYYAAYILDPDGHKIEALFMVDE